MVRTPLRILAQSAPLADIFAAQESVAFLYECAQRAVAIGHNVVRLIKCAATSDADLASFHQALNLFGRSHEF